MDGGLDGRIEPAGRNPFADLQVTEGRVFFKRKFRTEKIVPILSIKGYPGTVHLTKQEFRVFSHLYAARGSHISFEKLRTILNPEIYEDDEIDIPLNESNLTVYIKMLRDKIESLQSDTPRFTIGTWTGMGYYLLDKNNPPPFYEGGKHLQRRKNNREKPRSES